MYIGVDLGGTYIAAGLLDDSFNIIHLASVETKRQRKPCEIIRDIADLIDNIAKQLKIKKNEIYAIGIGIPGLADEKGNVVFCVNLNWTNEPLREILENRFGVPVYMENDATVACIAEYYKGELMGCSSGVMLTLGTGVGGGIILDGKPYSGFHGVGSELGHIIVGKNFYDCNCGRNGCLETFASSTAIIAHTKKMLEKPNTFSKITDKINNNFANLDAKIIFDCAKEGDLVANLAVQRLVKYLSAGIINIINFFDPEKIVLGGGIANAGEFLLEKVRDEINKNKYYKSLPSAEIALARMGNDAGIIGAAMLGSYKGQIKFEK